MQLLNKIKIRNISIFISLGLLLLFFHKCNDTRSRYSDNKNCYSYTKNLEKEIFIEVYELCGFWSFGSDLRCFHITDSLNFRVYLGHVNSNGYYNIEYNNDKISVEIVNPKSTFYDIRDTYLIKELKKLKNYK